MHKTEDVYSSIIFFNAVLPLMKVIANDVPDLKKKFRRILFRSNKINTVLCTSHGHVEQTPLLRVVDGQIFLDDK